jgi:hypothetical protein
MALLDIVGFIRWVYRRILNTITTYRIIVILEQAPEPATAYFYLSMAMTVNILPVYWNGWTH